MAGIEKISLAVLLLLRRRRRRQNKSGRKKVWARNWIARNLQQGAYCNLLREISCEDPESFRQFHRIDKCGYEKILRLVAPAITKEDTFMRKSLSPGEKLSITLRFLATGEKFKDLALLFRRGERTISYAVSETCKALYVAMKETYLKVPATTEEWEDVMQDFNSKWNYPCCIGAIDGKHVTIQQPSNSGSEYFNYKHFFSIILLALVDANYKFLFVDVGAPGRAGDAGVFQQSSLKIALDSFNNKLNLPPSQNIEGISKPITCHIVADDAFPMTDRIIKPYPQRHLDLEKRIFNYRLSRARRVVENAFGIFANRFRVFLTTVNLSPERVVDLVLAACCLHNFMIENNRHAYLGGHDLEDYYNINHDLALTSLSASSSNRNPTQLAKQQRDELAVFFSSEFGSVPWQKDMFNN